MLCFCQALIGVLYCSATHSDTCRNCNPHTDQACRPHRQRCQQRLSLALQHWPLSAVCTPVGLLQSQAQPGPHTAAHLVGVFSGR